MAKLTQGPSHREVRIAGALILAAGIVACGLSILSPQLGLGAEVAQEVFGWKRISLLTAGTAVAGVGALLLARPRVGAALVDWGALRPLDRAVRIVSLLAVAAGLAASGLAVLAEEVGVGAAGREGTFGRQRLGFLVLGGGGVALGALLFARPKLVSKFLDLHAVREARSRGARYLRLALFPPDRHLRYLAVGLVALLGLVLVWTRLIYIDQSMWHDEAYTVVNFSGVGPGPILLGELGYSANNHVLYNLLSWLTAGLLGESEAIYRLWSVVPGIAAVGVAAWWVWMRLGPPVALVFAALAVAAPLHLEYVQQARGYGLGLLAATLTLIAADRLTRSYSKRVLLSFIAAGLVGIWSLVLFAFVFVGQAASLLRWPRLRLPVIGATAAAGLLSLALYAPILDGMLATEVASGSGSGRGPSISVVAALLLDRPLEWLLIPTVTLLADTGPRAALDSGAGVVAGGPWGNWADVGALALLVLGLVALWRRGNGGLALILIAPPLFLNVALSISGDSVVARHQLFLLPHILVPAAVAIAEIGKLIARQRPLRPIAIAAGVAAILALSVATVERGQERALPRESFQRVGSIVSGLGIDSVVTDSERPHGLRYYLGDDLVEVSPSEVEPLLCQRSRELVYIHHLAYSPSSPAPAGLSCVTGKPSVRVSVPQRLRGPSIDIWVVNPRHTATARSPE